MDLMMTWYKLLYKVPLHYIVIVHMHFIGQMT